MINILDSLRQTYSDLHKDVHGCRWVPDTTDVAELRAALDRLQNELVIEEQYNYDLEAAKACDRAVARARGDNFQPTLANIWPTND